MKNHHIKQKINLNSFEPQYLIIDTECLYDYWSFQYRNENQDTTTVIECTTDEHFHQFYNEVLCNITRPMYFYSIDYDSTMINILCKLVEKNYTDINKHMRIINNMLMADLNYFQCNKVFWCDNYFDKGENFEQALNKTKYHYSSKGKTLEFLENYSDLLGKSKVFKQMMFCSIPKMMYYYTIKPDRTLVPSISLKKLQLIEENMMLKIDFNEFTSIQKIHSEGMYQTWINYCKNDVDFLYRFFQKHLLKKVKEKWLAVKATNSINKEFNLLNEVIYAENNTSLIVGILKIENPDKQIDFDYTQYISTKNSKFNKFVEFCNNNKHIKSDKELKQTYSEINKIEYIEDDYNKDEDVIINSFDEIQLKNIQCTFGLGGLHSKKYECILENLLHLDYRSQYPSIILQYKELYQNLINVNLLEAVYNKRNFEVKPRMKELLKIDDRSEQQEQEFKELQGFDVGLKLILNTSYGLINSNFNLSISSKVLGRFICLKGQSLLINLIDEIPENSHLVNVNTDGIIIKTDTDFSIEDDGYFVLGIDKLDKIVQKDVNNYIKVINGKVKTKGCFNVGIKKEINTTEKLSQNLKNAINIIAGKEIKKHPIYFSPRSFTIENKAYYLTSKENGTKIIKQTKKPQILGLNGEEFYFTDNPLLADYNIYKKYAEIMKERIFSFELEKKEVINYYEILLEDDTEENIKEKRRMRRFFTKLLNKCIGLSGFKGDYKKDCLFYNAGKQYIIKPLIQYNMTQILKSTVFNSFTLNTVDNDFIIIDVDIYDKHSKKAKSGWSKIKPLINELKKYNTFQCWNKGTEGYNKKFIFHNPDKKTYPKLNNKYFEIVDKAVIYSMDKYYDCNSKPPLNLPESIDSIIKNMV